ncbi:MAG: ATP-binding protein [Gemmatimonadales bacterium]|nr:ATP-binding protein [Gemmatimonadales bacterium]
MTVPAAEESTPAGPGVLPDSRRLLGWLLAARLVLAVLALLAAALVWTERADESFIVSVLVVFALVITGYAAWRVLVDGDPVGPSFLSVQALTDLLLVGAIVHVAGVRGAFAALYVPAIAIHALLLPVRMGLTFALLAGTLYLGDAVLLPSDPPDAAVWAQVAVFLLVFATVVFLGSRLRAAGDERATLASELQRARLEAGDILRSIRAGIVTVDGVGRLAFVNPMAEQLLRLGGDAALGRPVLELLRRRSPELWTAIESGLRGGRKVRRGEGQVKLEDGAQLPIGLSTTVFEPKPGDAPSVTAIFTDITDLKRLQELRLRAERSEAVAALSAGLAHEIRNPLASIRSAVELLARRAAPGEDERTLAGLIVRESDRLTNLLSEFLDFARVRPVRLEPVELRTVAEDVALLVRAHPAFAAGMRLVVEGGPLALRGDADLLHRALMNLALNAVQAAAGEPVTVTLRVGHAASGEAPSSLGGGRVARLEVQDTGPGVPEELRPRLFEPFVTGRPGGTGLGLAIVQRAVAAHRGVVLVDTATGAGTTFTIYLPQDVATEEAG